MSYTALYRKYRPDTFSEVKGQDAIVTTLKNQVRSGRTAHAYLFCGTRGTGKTSVAKILAKAVNCLDPREGEPCGECASCKAIASGHAMNVIEIDAASNNGVDNIRQIREEVAYSPTEGKYKVYIIDEVHMLSAGAFNALLKTLEEPPAYVVFILATTEAHKVPVTIISRCQKYDFRRISQEEIVRRLKDLFERENLKAEEKALKAIARKADGGMRDALSLADQCISFYLGQELTYEKVLNVLGSVETEENSALLREIADGNVKAVFARLDDMIFRGRDLQQLIADFTWYLRNVMVLKASEEAEDLLDVTQENLKLLLEDADRMSEDVLIRYIRNLGELSNQLRSSTNRRISVEVALLRLCRPQMQSDRLSVLQRLSKLEERMAEGYFVRDGGQAARSQAGANAGDPGRSGQDFPPGASEANTRYDMPTPQDLQQIREVWNGIVSGIESPRFATVLRKAALKFSASPGEEDCLVVVFGGFLGETYTRQPDRPKAELEGLIRDKIGKSIRVRFILESEEASQKDPLFSVVVEDAARKHIHTDIQMEEDDEDDE